MHDYVTPLLCIKECRIYLWTRNRIHHLCWPFLRSPLRPAVRPEIRWGGINNSTWEEKNQVNIKDTQCASAAAAVTPQEERSARSALGEESRRSGAPWPPEDAANTAAVSWSSGPQRATRWVIQIKSNTDCTEDNVQNTHTYTQHTQCTIKTYLVTNTHYTPYVHICIKSTSIHSNMWKYYVHICPHSMEMSAEILHLKNILALK